MDRFDDVRYPNDKELPIERELRSLEGTELGNIIQSVPWFTMEDQQRLSTRGWILSRQGESEEKRTARKQSREYFRKMRKSNTATILPSLIASIDLGENAESILAGDLNMLKVRLLQLQENPEMHDELLDMTSTAMFGLDIMIEEQIDKENR